MARDRRTPRLAREVTPQQHGLGPERTVRLSPFATLRQRGSIYNSTRTVSRVLDVLEQLALAPEALRAVEIARAGDLSPSSAHQILKNLVDAGYLIFDLTSMRYHLSPRMTRLGARISGGYFGSGALARLVHQVRDLSDGSVTLCASQGRFMQVLQNLPAPGAAIEGSGRDGAGAQVPLFGTCTGAAWLSMQSERLALRIIRQSRRELGRLARDEAGVLESLRRVRSQGYAFGGLLAEEGVSSVAVPLPPAANGVVLVIAVSAPGTWIEARAAELADLIRAQIRACLGEGAQSNLRELGGIQEDAQFSDR